MAGDGDSLVANAFHEIAVRGEHISAMIDDGREVRRHHPLGERHADRSRDPLPERTGRRFHTRRVTVLGMPGRPGPDLAERLQILDGQAFVAADARQIEERIEQHRAVAGRKHEPVAIRPVRIGGVELQYVAEKHSRDVGRAHRQAGMAALGFLHRVHSEETDRIGHGIVCRTRRHRGSPDALLALNLRPLKARSRSGYDH